MYNSLWIIVLVYHKAIKDISDPPLREGLSVFSDGPSTAFSSDGKVWEWKV